MMWLTGRLMPDFKTIANFRKVNAKALRGVCRAFVVLCRNPDLFAYGLVAIDSSKFKAVNRRDRNFTRTKMKSRLEQVEASIDRYLVALDRADCQEPEIAEARKARLQDKISSLKAQMTQLKTLEAEMLETPDKQLSLTDPDARSMMTSGQGSGTVGYNVQASIDAKHHLIVDHEVTNSGLDTGGQLWKMAKGAKEAVQRRLDLDPKKMAVCRCTAEHPFGTLKSWMEATHFLTRTIERVSAEMSLHVLAYNMKRMIKIMGIGPLLAAIRA